MSLKIQNYLINLTICCFSFIFLYYLLTSYIDHKINDLKLDLLRNNGASTPYLLLEKSPAPLTSIRIGLTEKMEKEAYYGGKGDQQHLGGWAKFDPNGVSNMTWDYMIGILGVKSLLDIGCGRGYSTNYFHSKGARVLCLEGSHDAVLHSLLPSPDLIVEHDFTRGPYWPEETFDACWSVEFLEHVSRQYFKNYINAFRKCALIFITASAWGGYHHVEIHGEYWWKGRFTAAGFVYSSDVSRAIKDVPIVERDLLIEKVINSTAPHLRTQKFMKKLDRDINAMGQHIRHGMMVFINPAVGSLPAHDHLFAGDGCYKGPYLANTDGGTPCLGNDRLPRKYESLLRCYRDMELGKVVGKSVSDMYWTCTANT